MEARKSYTLSFKKTVLKTLDENNGNISATSKICSVDRKNIRRWKNQRTTIEKVCITRGVKSRFKRRIRLTKAKFPLLEDALVQYVKEERGKRQTVTGKMIRRKATTLFPNIYPNPAETFKASNGWLTRMLNRNNLSYRRVTSVGQKIPVDAPERADRFLAEMKDCSKDYKMILNMDETPCHFDVPRSTTYDFSGIQTVKVATTGHEKLRFTAVLTAGVQKQGDEYKAFKLPPMLIFKNLKKAPKGTYPPGMVIEGSKGGTMTRVMMLDKYNGLFKKRPGCFFKQTKSLLIMDTARSHMGDEVGSAFQNLETDVKYIDGGMTPLL